MIVIRKPKMFYDFDLPEDFDKNLKHEIEYIIKNYESLAEIKIQNKK